MPPKTVVPTPAHPANHVDFFKVLFKLGDFVALINTVLGDVNQYQSGQPVDLEALSTEAHTIASDFGLKLPDWMNNAQMILAFIQGGVNAVQAQKPSV